VSEPIRDAARLRYPALDRVIEHALRCSPEECVGFLLGGQSVESIWPLRNVARYPRHGFELDPQEVAEVLFQEKPVVGLYHSHPGVAPVYPSSQDLGCGIPVGWHYWILGDGCWYRRVFTSEKT